MPIIGEWLDSIWLGQNNSYRAIRKVSGLPPVLPKADRPKPRAASPAMKQALVSRDGFHCRLCGIPLIRTEVRRTLNRLYPEAARWTGIKASEQHRGLQVMWLQYDQRSCSFPRRRDEHGEPSRDVFCLQFRPRPVHDE